MGIMTPAGMGKVEAAKKDGSWNILDDIEDLIIPEDLQKALESNKTARKHFNGFSDSVKKQILWWITSAKRPETRLRRIEKTITLSEQNKRL